MTNEEIQAVKSTNTCHEVQLTWKVANINGTELLVAMCSVCFQEYTKTKPAPVSLD